MFMVLDGGAMLYEIVKKTRTPSNLFEIKSLQVKTPKGSNVKFGTRKVYVDFPRVAYFIQQIILEICSSKIPQIASKTIEDAFNKIREVKSAVDEINNEKKDPKTDLGYLTECLEKLGVKWSCVYTPIYKKPILKFYTNKYFKELWTTKLVQFINDLNSGNDNPIEIYKKVQTLTPEYKKVQEYVHTKPKIFEIFLSSEINPYKKELERVWGISQKLMKLIDPYEYGNPKLYREIDKIFMDIKTIIHQIHLILESGYCFSGYLLLRKLLTNFALIIFYDSLINWLLKQKIEVRGWIDGGEDGRDIISKYVSEFSHKWASLYPYKDLIIYEEEQEEKSRKYFKITSIDDFVSKYRKGHLIRELTAGSYIDLKDRFLRETLDVVIALSVDIFEFAEGNYKLDSRDKVVSIEYGKLSEIVHEPIHIDFPPFSSLLEYIGFLHHLRKVRQLLDLVIKNYRRFIISQNNNSNR